VACSPAESFARAPDEPGTLGFLLENDLAFGNDRYYTSGLRVHWVSGHGAGTPAWAASLAERMPWLAPRGPLRHGYAFGQSIFTPHDVASPDPPPDDRPYAGWLYGSVGLSVESERQLDVLSLTVGNVGPAALAERSQKLIHEMLSGSEAQGWNTQLGNEPGLVLAWQRAWREPAAPWGSRAEWDVTPHAGAAIGNVFTHGSAGATVRLGRQLPADYGPPRIHPGVSGTGGFASPPEFGWHAFAGFEVRAVARNLLLDGNTFRDSRSVDKNRLLADFQVGIVLDWPGVRLHYSHVFRSREFRTQTGQAHFGALGLSVKFGGR
jgi:lipid A 3-O-deacylase